MIETIFWIFSGLAVVAIVIHLIQNNTAPSAVARTSSSEDPRQSTAEDRLNFELARLERNLSSSGIVRSGPASNQDRQNIFFDKRERPDGFHRKFVEHEPVAGASHYQPAYEKLYAAKNAQITLLAEPDNKFDPNAIAVKADIGSEELHLGYLSRKLANRFSQQVPSHVPTFARLTTIIPPNNGMHGGARIEIWLPRRDLWDKYK